MKVLSVQGTPAAGAVVSDGTRVARTDASGIARLDCEGPFVYLVSRIPGADTIWYLPSDAPDLCFTASSSPADEISFVHVTDLHVTDPFAGGRPRRFEVACDRAVAELARMEAPASEQRVRALFDQLPRLAPSAGFVVATGDLTDRASDAEFEAYRRASRGSLPVVDVPGNHDHRVDDEGHLDVSAYERHLGPRWYSFDVGPVHLVVLDWFSWTLRRDDDQQRAWLAADLTLAGGRPWVLLAHDRIRDLDLTALPRPPVAAFTGHWHATRIVHHGGTAHVATGSPLFAGLDRTVPSLREATISEHGLRLRSVVPPTGTPLEGGRPGTSLARTRDALDAPAGWARRLPGSGMSGPPVAAGEFALITSTDEDRGRSTVTALEHMTGEPVWQVTFAEQFRDSPAVEGDLAVLASVSGTLHCLEVRSGTKRWSRAALDPLLSWVTNTPSIGRGLVLSGDASAVVACRLEDGTLVWQRRDLGQHLNHVNYTAPTVVGGHVVVGFWPQAPGLIVLDANSGQVQTPDNAVEHAATAGWGDGIPRAPRADLVRIAEDVLVMEAGRLVRRTLPDATERWSVPAPGLFAIAAPVVARDVVLLVDHGTALQARDAGTGRWLWRFDQSGDAALPRLPYARVGAALASAPALADDVAVLGLSDGRLRVVRLDSGAVVGRGSVPGALLEHPVVIGDTIVTLDLDGVARGVPLPAVRQEPEAVAGQAVTA